MTIRQWIINGALAGATERLAKLEEMEAPPVVIEGQRKMVDNLRNGQLKIGGNADLLEGEFETVEAKKGNGGKTYYVINGGINFFPAARYGMFITRATSRK